MLQQAEDDPHSALGNLRQGLRLWQEIDAPYEAARTRMWAALAYRADGDEESARLELEAARSTFERLGARRDAARATELLNAVSGQAMVKAVRATRTFMFTDIVKSTDLIGVIGDEAWEHLLRWHDETLRELFTAHNGDEIKHQGEGFFVAFDDPDCALACAVAIQSRLAAHRRQHGFAPQVRIGLHTTEATQRGHDYGGRGVHQAARIGAIADGAEILASAETLGSASGEFAASEPRSVTLKGIPEPVEVVAIEWR
jgi:class 3 adenylate cyclase